MNIKTAALAASTAMAIPAAAAYAAELNLICSADVVICEKLLSAFEAGHSDISVNMVRLSSGEAYAKVRAEGRNPQTDLWWGGTGDPQLQAITIALRCFDDGAFDRQRMTVMCGECAGVRRECEAQPAEREHQQQDVQ